MRAGNPVSAKGKTKVMFRYAYTLCGILLATLLTTLSYFFNLDLFDRFAHLLKQLEHLEIDEILVALVIILLFFQIDVFRKRHETAVEKEKVKIYRAMLFGMHHILNNFLQQMQLFKWTAEKTPGFDPDVLKLYDQVIAETTQQIQAIGNVGKIDDEDIRQSVLPK